MLYPLRSVAAIAIMLAAMLFHAASGFAAETIRVGMFSLSGFYTPLQDGEYKASGYAYDFLRTYSDAASNPQYKTFATVRECFEALRKGQVMAVYANSLVAEHLRREFDYSRFMVASLPGHKEALCFAHSRDVDPHLLSIFNKIVLNASDETMQNIISPNLIELEVTENIVNSTPELLQSQLEELLACGFHVAMDDFGTGYSSLNLLKNMPIDILKLDKDFLQQGIVSEKERIIITGFVTMAQKLKFTVVCEGVETAEQAHFLRSIGCDQAQGFLFAKPMPKGDFENRLYG